jgi:WD40 repeat protein
MSPTGRFVWSSSGSIETASGKQLQKVNRKNLSEHPEWIPPVWLGESHVAEVLLLQKKDSQNSTAVERSIVLWSTGTDDPAAIANAPEANALAASPDGGQIAEAGKDMRVRIRNGTTLAVERTLRVHDDAVIGVAWHPTLPLLATASEDFSVRIWDLRTDTLVEEFRSTRNTPALRLKWSPDGRFLGVSYQAPTENVKIYEPAACKQADSPIR